MQLNVVKWTDKEKQILTRLECLGKTIEIFHHPPSCAVWVEYPFIRENNGGCWYENDIEEYFEIKEARSSTGRALVFEASTCEFESRRA